MKFCWKYFFTAYCESLPLSIPSGVNLQGFADDHFVHKSFKAGNKAAENETINLLSSTFDSIQNWMGGMRLKLNPDKTEFIIIGNQPQLNKLTTKTITAGESVIPTSDCVRCLGTHIDENLKFTTHVTLKCKTAMWNFTRIRSIRSYLNKSTCETLVLALVMSHLDYSNSILSGCPEVLINKYQRIQNLCAKLVLCRDQYSSSSQALIDLHWLPIIYRIKFKISCLVHKCQYGKAPEYLKCMLIIKPEQSRNLRSKNSDELKLTVPWCKLKTFAERSFSIQGPRTWNSLPLSLRSITNYDTFKSNLKTHYFNLFVNSCA